MWNERLTRRMWISVASARVCVDANLSANRFSGQVGYISCGMKSTKEAQLGDTIFHVNHPVDPISRLERSKPVVFGSVYPTLQKDYAVLQSALNRLALNDRSVSVENCSSYVLGNFVGIHAQNFVLCLFQTQWCWMTCRVFRVPPVMKLVALKRRWRPVLQAKRNSKPVE